jgi:aspartyl-tRNA(Asn)/glutamyl-tRNA(Gln) amidotransferase subunit A
MQPDVGAVLGSVLDRISDRGAEIEEVEVVDPDEVIATIFVILAAEASAYHRRRLREHPERYGDDVLAYLELGMGLAAADYVDAQRLRAVYRDRLNAVLGAADLVLAPAQHVTAPFPDREELEFADGTVLPRDLTLIRPLSLCSLTGHPAVSIPVGWSPDGLPIGIQVIGPPHAEHDVLDLGAVIQQLAGWTPRMPALPISRRVTP